MVVVLVSGLASVDFGGFAWAFHAVARLRSSVSIFVFGDRVGCCILAKWVFLAVSSIPFWSVWVRPWAFGIPFVIFHNVIIAGDLFSGGSSFSQDPLNSLSLSTVRIISLLEVISMISVVGRWLAGL